MFGHPFRRLDRFAALHWMIWIECLIPSTTRQGKSAVVTRGRSLPIVAAVGLGTVAGIVVAGAGVWANRSS